MKNSRREDLLFRLMLVMIGIYSFTPVQSQTCCSGGVPLANNIGGLAPADRGSLQLSLNFDGNFLYTLKDGTETLDDESRERTTYSMLVKANYAVTEKLAVEVLFTGVRQERKIRQGNFSDFTSTNGLGDAVVMAYYKYLDNNGLNMVFGAGPKVPIGPSDLKNNNGITLNADLQPGSGAWDMVLHHRVSKSFGFRPAANFFQLINYRITGENPDYLGSQRYQFGNELQVLLGVSEQNNIGGALVSYGLNIRYRRAGQDINNGEILPNAGGQWIFLMPALSWYVTPDLAFTANGELPVYSQVDGAQLTPTFRINMGIYWILKSKTDIGQF